MTEWEVQVEGHPLFLAELVAAVTDPLSIWEVAPGLYRFTHPSFACFGEPDGYRVRERASQLLGQLSSAYSGMRSFPTALTAGHLYSRTGNVTNTVMTPGTAVTMIGELVAIVTRSGEAPQARNPPKQIQLFNLAQTDPTVARYLAHVAYGDLLTWAGLYKIVELVLDNSGGSKAVCDKGWTTGNQLSRFNHTACSPQILGVEARHGSERTQPPKNPMTFEEAETLVKSLVDNWLRTLGIV